MTFRQTLDKTDVMILDALMRNARLTYKEIGEIVGLTRPAARERILRLEELGVIKGYSAQINTEMLGYSLRMIISFKFDPDRKFDGKPNDTLIPMLNAAPNVLRYWEIYGDLDFLIEAVFDSKDSTHSFLDDLRNYGFVRSHLVAAECEKSSIPPESALLL